VLGDELTSIRSAQRGRLPRNAWAAARSEQFGVGRRRQVTGFLAEEVAENGFAVIFQILKRLEQPLGRSIHVFCSAAEGTNNVLDLRDTPTRRRAPARLATLCIGALM
jgi:hypothetical protein